MFLVKPATFPVPKLNVAGSSPVSRSIISKGYVTFHPLGYSPPLGYSTWVAAVGQLQGSWGGDKAGSSLRRGEEPEPQSESNGASRVRWKRLRGSLAQPPRWNRAAASGIIEP